LGKGRGPVKKKVLRQGNRSPLDARRQPRKRATELNLLNGAVAGKVGPHDTTQGGCVATAKTNKKIGNKRHSGYHHSPNTHKKHTKQGLGTKSKRRKKRNEVTERGVMNKPDRLGKEGAAKNSKK